MPINSGMSPLDHVVYCARSFHHTSYINQTDIPNYSLLSGNGFCKILGVKLKLSMADNPQTVRLKTSMYMVLLFRPSDYRLCELLPRRLS
jgi:hypothetical protein